VQEGVASTTPENGTVAVGAIMSPSASATGAATSATDAMTPTSIATRRTKQRLVPVI
jgi:hypothetical protein